MKNFYYEGIIENLNDDFLQRLEDEDMEFYKSPDGKIHWTCSNPKKIFAGDFEEDLEDEMDDILKGKVV